mmetsp:Transcript_16952/g.38939  ORF Transcript_16952/g.38939 Transcript_16952/m.38939 type:complete len:219 (-) Transcript_16952:873-1529(-)|eukprot:CAMPEP_0201122494 /NCGR_PEP_ID=MMETSP0850-20130426/6125_1 /ASSEMBLY_ACC=CAM_ASM_000622 /TAXON_ID=183588 /ORGANISM="Pseudo-nitzschia fraudulenta, Strain WWA7" /LENGTH=218 /DNA_ID=CAMNT_0047389201 /DNA_START=181 /DNA_END=837 /DNA_ORIENTATION=+
MKLFSVTVLLLQLAAIEAFTGSVRVLLKPAVAGRSASVRPHHMGDIDHGPLPNDNEESLVVYDNVAVALDDDAWEMAMKVVAALVAVALTVGAGVATTRPAFAADSDQLFSSLPTVVLSAASIKDDDIVDFSMPSYEAASRAEVNSNLKGDKYLLGEASRNYGSSSSSSSSEETVVEEKAAPVVDEKAEKAAAKAAAKAARAKQQAEIEAAAKAAAGN